jgi:hypothetical protein
MIRLRPHRQKLTSAHRRAARQRTMLPQLFAIHTGRTTTTTYRYDFGSGSSDPDMVPDYMTGRVAIFQARPCHDGRGGGSSHYDPWILRDVPHAAYRVSPYRIHTGSGEDRDRISAFVLEGRFGSSTIPSDGPVTLYSEDRGPPPAAPRSHGYYEDYEPPRDRTSIYRGHWRYSGYTMFSMYCATPIPILVFTDGGRDREEIEWPAPHYNRIAVAEGDRTIIRVWAQRWDPAMWEATIEDAYAEQEARRAARRSRIPPAAASGGGGGRSTAAPAPAPAPPKFVTDLIVADAIAKGATCPITMEPLKADKVTVTACYHVFDTDALNTWAAAQIATAEAATTTVCPQCRKGL